MKLRQLPIVFAVALLVLLAGIASAFDDCNGNDIDDLCEISCGNPGCSGVSGCGDQDESAVCGL